MIRRLEEERGKNFYVEGGEREQRGERESGETPDEKLESPKKNHY